MSIKTISLGFRILFALMLLFLLADGLEMTPAQAGGTRFVKPTASGLGDCSSWSNACGLQTGLTGASSGDEIWVAAGTYYPTATTTRSITFQLKNGVALYGGFAGTVETLRTQRDFAANITILSGDIGTLGVNTDNSYHVANGVFGATLDGFTITGGNANGAGFNEDNGGGMINSSNPTLANLIISGNTATTTGGGMANLGGSNPSLTNVTFSGNSARFGGGMYGSLSSPILTNVTFSGNTATNNGGGMYDNDRSSPTLTNVTFAGNSAAAGGGMFNSGTSNPSLTNVTFSNNSSPQGGGMYNSGSSPTLTNVTFNGNTATSFGGGMYNSSSNPVLTNATFNGNTATVNSGEMYNSFSQPIIRNSIFWDSLAAGQIYNQIYYPTISDSVIKGGCPAGSTCSNIITSDPNLGTLGAYGGFTKTMPLLAGSSALYGAHSNCPLRDQRDNLRNDFAAACDIGAYETDTHLVPNSGPLAGGTTVTITGVDLSGASGVTVDGVPGTPFTALNSTHLSFVTPAHAAGGVDVAVVGSASPASLTNAFTYIPSPTISSVAPVTGTVAGGTSLVITGTNLTGVSAVTFGGTAAVCTVTDDAHLSCTSPVHAGGAANVTVTTPGGAATAAGGFLYFYGTPTISSVVPATGTVAGGTSLVITGTNLTGLSSVTFGGTPAACTVTNDTHLSCTSPAHAVGVVNVAAITPGGTATATNGFTYNYGTPSITGLVPNSGSIDGGTSMVVTGTNLTGLSSVTFGGTAAACTVTDDTHLSCTSPAHTAGAVNVAAITPGGTATATGGFTYFAHSYTLTVPANTYDYYRPSAVTINIASGLAAASAPSDGSGTIDGAVVIISSGFQAGDTLDATASGGVARSYNTVSGVLTLSGTADISVYETVLQSITFATTSANTTPRKVTYSLGSSIPYRSTGHFFEYVTATMDWNTAKTAAAARTYFGRTGYLATINDAGENAFANTKIGGQGAWIGGSDAAVEGTWKWVTGPEAGSTFCIGRSPCVLKAGWYMGWDPSGFTEPNDYSPGEDYTQFEAGSNGYWNDLKGAAGGGSGQYAVAGYVVEYGDMPGDNPMVIQGSVTVNVRSNLVQPTPIITWADPANIVYGTPLSVTQLNATASVPGTFTYTPNATTVLNGGAHTLHVDFTPTDTASYTRAAKDVTLNVIMVVPTITFSTAPAPIYQGGVFTVSAATTNTDSPTVTYSKVGGPCEFVGGATFRSTGAGTCTVQADGAETINFAAAAPATQSISIAMATPILSVTNSPRIFNGSPQAVAIDSSIAGSVSNVKYAGSAIVPTDAGAYLVTADFLPDDALNYITLTDQAVGTFIISPKALTMSGLTVSASKVYDGTAAAVVSGTPALQSSEAAGTGTTSDGKPYTGEDVSITGAPSGTYNRTDTAAATVTFGGLSLTGAQAGNYTLTIQAPAAAEISAKALTMSGLTVSASKVYDGTAAAVVSGTPALLASEAAGSGTAGDGKPYTGDTVNITGTPSGTYDRTDIAAATVTFGGLSLTGAQADNYTLTIQAPAAAAINAKVLTITGLTANGKTYDGTTANNGFSGGSLVGVVGAEDVSLDKTGASGTFASPNAGPGIAVSSSGFALSGADKDNYGLTQPSGLTAAINKATPVLTWADPGAIVYGTALDSTQLNATANVPGALVYSPISGTVLAVGTQKLRVDFTPTDSNNYFSPLKEVDITINAVAPAATTQAASGVTLTSATLNGTVNAFTASTTVSFEYGLTSAYGTIATASQSPLTGATNTSVTAALSGLIPDMIYHFRVAASSPGGTTNGLDQTFMTSHSPGVRYVKGAASGLGNCSSWSNACGLQTALTGAVSGDELWVAAGTYTPGTVRTDTFQLKTGTAVYGGFAGTETARDQRNPAANATVLSGEIGAAGSSDNVYHVVSGASGATLDGFTITAGNANGGSANSYGGGMYNFNSSPALANLTFNGSSADWGGGMFNENSSPALTNITFSGNTASTGGGGLANVNSSSPVLTNVTFSGNSVTNGFGGGITNHTSSNPTLVNVTFSNNTATNGSGGGMSNVNSSPTVRNSIFWGNTAVGAPASEWQILSSGGATVVTDSIVEGGYTGTAVSGSDPKLGTLGVYGGFTPTLPLLPGSSAIDAGNGAYCSVGSDQRGVSYTGACDLGAFESQGFTFASQTGTPQSAAIHSAFASPLGLSVTARGAGEPVNGGLVTFTAPDSGASTAPAIFMAAIAGGSASAAVTANGSAGGAYSVTASAAGANSVNFLLTNSMANQAGLTVIATPTALTYGSTAALSTSGGSGTGAVTFDKGASSGCSISGSTLSVTDASGTCAVSATKAADTNYNAATSAALSVTLFKANQASLTVLVNPATLVFGGTAALSASGGSGTGAVTYSSGSSTGCDLLGSSLFMQDATGTCAVTARKAGDNNYNLITSAPFSVTLSKANPNVSVWPTASAITYGQTLASSTLTGGSSTPAGSFAFTTPATAPAAGTAAQGVTFTPNDTTNYTTVTGTVNVTANKANSNVSVWPGASAITYGQTLADSSLTGGSSTPSGSFAFTTPATAPNAGTASQGVTFTPTDTANYNPSSGTASVTVNKADANVTGWPTASAITYGQTLASSILTGGSSTPSGSFGFTTPATAPNAGSALQGVTFTPADLANYKTASGTASVTVNKANSNVSTWPTASAITYGQSLANSTLSGGSSVPAGSFAFTAPSTAPNAGTAAQGVTFTPTDTANYNPSSGTANVTVNKVNSNVSVWPVASAITYGQTLADSSLTGGSSTPSGSFAFTTPAAAPNAGTAAQGVTFTPTDTINYTTVNGSISITVNQANQASLSVIATPATVVYGSTAALSTSGGSGTGAVTFDKGASTGCSISGSTLSVTDASGTCAVTAAKAADTNYNAAASAALSVTLSKANQAGLTVIATPTALTYGSTAALSTSGGSGTGAVTFDKGASTGCSISGSTLSVTAASGTCAVTAAKAADTNYNAAASAALPITMVKAASVITWADPGDIDYGTALGSTQLNATANVPGVLVYAPVSGTVLAVGTQILRVDFTPTDSNNYFSAFKEVDITVKAVAPAATTNAASLVTTTSATLNGTVNALTASTTVWFEYGLTTAYGSTAAASQSPLTGATNTSVTAILSGLTPNATYHFRVTGSNAGGMTNGLDGTFTTSAAAPTAVTTAASGITTTTVNLNGTLNAKNASTTVTFEYGLTAAYGSTATALQSPVTGTSNTNVTAAITGLISNTTYHFRVTGSNAGGTTNGLDLTFTTNAFPPSTATHPASDVTTTSATLNGTVNDNNASTSVWFEYGLTTAYGSTATASQSPLTGATNTSVTAALSGLTPDRIYHFRVTGDNAGGTTHGVDLTFMTSHSPGVRYVKGAASGLGNCSSWSNACGLQTALTGAVSGDELWVAAGTYTPGTVRTDTFQLKTGTAVYGGFAGTETARDQRNPAANATVLSGEIGAAGSSDNVYHVVSGASGATLDGFTITAGNANGGSANSYGGGMYNFNSSPVLTNLIFMDNLATRGGGMYNENSSPSLANVTFSNNAVTGLSAYGGGMYNLSGSSPSLTNVTFSGNTATTGGGGLTNVTNSNPTLTNVTFSGNSVTNGFGGGMISSGSNPTLQNTIFWGNAASLGSISDWQIYILSGTAVVTDSVVEGGYTGTAISGNNPKLGTLGVYGGFTPTIPLLPGSSAIDAGNGAYCSVGSDQRGVSYTGACDLGAFESQGFTFASQIGTPQSTAIHSAFASPLGLSVTARGAGEPVNGGVVTFTAPDSGASTAPAIFTAAIAGGTASVAVTANGSAGGAYSVTASAAGANSVNFLLTNTKINQVIHFTSVPVNAIIDGTPYTPTATGGGSGNGVSFTIDASAASVCSILNQTVSFLAFGTCVVDANQAGDANYQDAAQVQQSFEISKITPVITFDPAPTPIFLGGDFSVHATTNNTESATLSYSKVSGSCAFMGGSTFRSSGAGTCIVRADAIDTTKFKAAAQTQHVQINRATPTLLVVNSPVPYHGAAQAAELSAGSVVGTFSNVRYNGSLTAPTQAGSYAVTADFTPVNSVDYNSLAGISAGSLVISKATPVLALTNSPVLYNGSAQAAVISAGAVAGTIQNVTYDGSLVAPTVAGTYAVTADFTPDDTANYNSLAGVLVGSFVIDYNPETPLIAWDDPTDIVYGTALDATQLNATVAGVAGVFAYNPGPGAILSAGAHSLHVTFTPTDGNNYNVSSKDVSITVTQAATTISIGSSANPAPFGQPVTFSAIVAADAGTPEGTVTFKDGAVTLGTGVLSDGIATLLTNAIETGERSITAEFNGEGNFAASVSDALTQTVTPVDAAIALASSVNQTPQGQTWTFKVTITLIPDQAAQSNAAALDAAAAADYGAAAGTVTLKDGPVVLATSRLEADGTATFVLTTLSPGTHQITAEFSQGIVSPYTVSAPVTVANFYHVMLPLVMK